MAVPMGPEPDPAYPSIRGWMGRRSCPNRSTGCDPETSFRGIRDTVDSPMETISAGTSSLFPGISRCASIPAGRRAMCLPREARHSNHPSRLLDGLGPFQGGFNSIPGNVVMQFLLVRFSEAL